MFTAADQVNNRGGDSTQKWSEKYEFQIDAAIVVKELIVVNTTCALVETGAVPRVVQTILFAVISETGQRFLHKIVFDMAEDGPQNIVSKQLMKKPAYIDKFTLKQVVATNEKSSVGKKEKLALLVNYKEEV